MALEMRDRVVELDRQMAASSATTSASASASRTATPRSARIGFEGRFDYAAIGTRVERRLAPVRRGQERADPDQPARALAVEKDVTVEPAGEFELKGIRRPMAVHNVVDWLNPRPIDGLI